MISMLSKTMPNNLASFSAVSYEKASLLQRVAIQAPPFLFTQPGKIVSYMQVGLSASLPFEGTVTSMAVVSSGEQRLLFGLEKMLVEQTQESRSPMRSCRVAWE